MGTAVDRADTLDEFGGGQEAIRFEHLALAMQPLRFNRIEPGALTGQQGADETHAVAALMAGVVALDGSRIGTLANITIHPVALGPECLAVSSDWVGSFRRALEARVGGRAVLLSGALGDVNPHHVHRVPNHEDAVHAGPGHWPTAL